MDHYDAAEVRAFSDRRRPSRARGLRVRLIPVVVAFLTGPLGDRHRSRGTTGQAHRPERTRTDHQSGSYAQQRHVHAPRCSQVRSRCPGRWLLLTEEITQLDTHLAVLVESAAPSLLDIKGVGVATAATLLAATGDNPTRLRSDRSFAALCGSSPVDASSGRQLRHRLNRGGDRQANCYLIVLNRLSWDQRSKDYVVRRTAEGKTKKEIIRCLKRYVAREVYQAIMGDMADQVAPITTLKAFQRAA